MSSTYYLTPNNQTNGVYTGLAYVFDTSGGFSVDQSFPQINLNTYTPIAQYDVTEAIQIKFSVRTLNNKIGVIKDQTNVKVLEVLYYDISNELLTDVYGNTTDSVSISAEEFLKGVHTNNIVSMGKMSTLYSDFNYTVMEYFGAPYGFSSVFANATDFNANNGVFDSTAFINLINGITFDGVTGSVISDLSGYFKVNDLNKHLRFICGTNVFGNRPPTDNNGIANGFLPGDLIYIPNGISVTLSVAVEPEPYSPPDNVGPTNLHAVDSLVNYSDPQNNIHKVTTSTISNITQTYSVPILIILDNEDTFNFNQYGGIWVDIGYDADGVSLGNQGWIAVAMSALGTYQSAVNELGDVYISQDYGKSWYLVYNIGPGTVISIGVSQDGTYQTISNGFQIFRSEDSGLSWDPVFNVGASNVFVSVSLSGKQQAVLSCGDSLYSSSDYGRTWRRFEETDNAELYNSIETFPTGGISLSFSGQYQSIACEAVWLSSDYGQTWRVATLPNPTGDPVDFNERNWDGISISSDGKIQSATDSGGYIYNSQDHGETWVSADITKTGNRIWEAIAISANANFQTALDIDGYIFLSLDFGSTWNLTTDTNTFGRKWQGVAVSANGQYQTAIEYGGTIWASNLL